MSKYHNITTIADGIAFDSKREAKRYAELCLLQRAGEISNLELQPRYDLVVNGQRCGFYKADFRYRDSDGALHIEDAKGVRTSVYALKKRLVEAIYGITITEV